MNACIYRDAKSDGTHHEVKFADTDHSGEYIHTYIHTNIHTVYMHSYCITSLKFYIMISKEILYVEYRYQVAYFYT